MSSIPKPANHPRQCQICEGTGWEQIAPLKSKANGFDVEYSQLVPCTNQHPFDDDPDMDEHGYSRTRIPTRAEGLAIARAEYELECRRQGRTPDPDWFRNWL